MREGVCRGSGCPRLRKLSRISTWWRGRTPPGHESRGCGSVMKRERHRIPSDLSRAGCSWFGSSSNRPTSCSDLALEPSRWDSSLSDGSPTLHRSASGLDRAGSWPGVGSYPKISSLPSGQMRLFANLGPSEVAAPPSFRPPEGGMVSRNRIARAGGDGLSYTDRADLGKVVAFWAEFCFDAPSGGRTCSVSSSSQK